MKLLSWFMADSGPSVHITPLTVLHFGPVTITNSILYGWICLAVMITILILLARRVSVKPKGGAIPLLEVGAEFIATTVTSAFEDKARARKYVPFFVTLFFFLLVNNWLGLLPGVGDALHIGDSPLLRPFTADLNGTLAAAAATMIFIYVASVREFGSFRKFFRHFFAGSPLNPLYFSIGILEIFSNLMRVVSLSLRLFLNVAIGEVIIAIFGYLGHVLASVTSTPFFLFDLFEGALQAFIFTLLSVMYLASATNHASHEAAHAEGEGLTPERTAETIEEHTAQADVI